MAKAKAKRISREERRRQREQARRKRVLLWIGLAVLALALVGFVAWRNVSEPEPGEAVRSMGNEHIGPEQVGTIVYNSTPPTSGPHLGQLARWGIHTEPIPNELQVHNLEDGGVMVQYSCEDCEDLVEQLGGVVGRYDERVILAPYPAMDSRIALTAWGRIDTFDDFEEERVIAFVDAYAGDDHHAAGP
jgi:hypothetical protein